MHRKRVISSLVLALSGAIGGVNVHAQDYPTKPIRFIIPFPPGGATDAYARILGQRMNESWGQPVVVDSRPGAGGNIAAELAAKSSPDGYAIILVGMSHAVNVSLYGKIAYHPVRDFTPITQVALADVFLLVNPSLPVKSVKELVALAKAKPGQLNYGSGGNGQPGHLAGEMMNMLADIKLVHIPYKGSLSMIGLISGEHSVEFNNLPSAGAQIKAGKVRVLAMTNTKRSTLMPEVPTMIEAGLPGFELVQWFGVFAPAGTPQPVVKKLNAEMVRTLKLPEVTKRLADLGSESAPSTPEQLGALVASEIGKWAKVIKTANMRVD